MPLRCALLALFCAAGCPEAPVLRLSAGGFEARRVEAYGAPVADTAARVRTPGDFVLTSPGVSVLVGGMRRLAPLRGVLLELSPRAGLAGDSIERLRWQVYVGRQRVEPRVARMYIAAYAGRPALYMKGTAQLRDQVLALTWRLQLAERGILRVHTTVSTRAPGGAARVRLGARVRWGGPHPFVPGHGLLHDEGWHRGAWQGVDGDRVSTVFSLAPVIGLVRGVYERHGATRFLARTEHVGPAFDLARGEAHAVRSVLAIAAGGVAAGVRRVAWARGQPIREAWIQLPHRPPGAHVRLSDAKGRPLLSGRPDARGRVALPLVGPDGRGVSGARAQAFAYGHAPSAPVTLDGRRSERHVLRIPRGGQIRIRAVDAHSGLPLPARVRLEGIEGTQTPALGPDHRAAGAGDSVISVAGQVPIAVPPGRYRVRVSHGLEWTMSQREVTVTETFGPQVDAYLTRVIDPGDWVACDLHVHAAPSPDSQVSLEDRLRSLVAEGVRFAVPTDHNHVTDYAPAARRLGLADFGTVSGVEVSTWAPAFGHFNAFPYPKNPARPGNGAPPFQGVDPGVLFAALHAMDPDLVVQVNHPRLDGGDIGYFDRMGLDSESGAADLRFSDDFDLLEVFNGFDLARPARAARVFDDWLALLESGLRLVGTGSSDSHQVRYQLAGYPRTYVRVPGGQVGDGREVVRALKAGRAFVTSGPFLEVSTPQGAGPGDVVRAEHGSVALAVRVQAPAWVPVDRLEIFVGRRRVLDLALDGPAPAAARRGPRARAARAAKRSTTERFSGRLRVAVERDSALVVRVSSERSAAPFFGRWGVRPLAFSNPIFVDGDGDGETPWGSVTPPSSP